VYGIHTVAVRLKTAPPQVLDVHVGATWRGQRMGQIVERTRPRRCGWWILTTLG
jgi:hypothetical protein